MEKQGIYAYAVVGNRQVKMDDMCLVHYRDLTLVGKMIDVSYFQKELQEALKNPKTMETVLTEHQEVLDRLMGETAVVPFQFGTILKDKEGAVTHLTSSYARYKGLLKKFKDREEWGVRIFADLKKSKVSIVQKSSSGTAYLLRKKQEEETEESTNEKLTLFSEEILFSLKEFAFEYKVTKSSQRFSEKGELLISAFAFLLDTAKIKKFTQKLAEIEKKYHECGLRLIRSGPWPAYNFVS